MADISTRPRQTDAEFAADLAERQARVAAASREMVAEARARKPDPRSIHDYRGYLSLGLVCVMVVKHRDGAASFHCSKDGNGLRFNLAFSKSIRQPESSDDFLLVCIPKWIAKDRGLLGVTPDLDGDWTDAQREMWKSLSNSRITINTKIHYAKKRPASILTRSDVA